MTAFGIGLSNVIKAPCTELTCIPSHGAGISSVCYTGSLWMALRVRTYILEKTVHVWLKNGHAVVF